MSQKSDQYWKANQRLLAGILVVWFLVSFLAGIVFSEFLNQFEFLGYPLGFWFAQQGSIYTFVVLIFFYSWRMSKLDKKFGLNE